jgi:hypothetical protein
MSAMTPGGKNRYECPEPSEPRGFLVQRVIRGPATEYAQADVGFEERVDGAGQGLRMYLEHVAQDR